MSNIIYAITDIHCCFSSNMISCCATCFAQIEMFLIQCYNSTVSLSYPPTCSKAVICLSTLENTLQNRPSWKCKFFHGLALTRIESKASLFSKGCTAYKQTYWRLRLFCVPKHFVMLVIVHRTNTTSSIKPLQWIQCAEQIYNQMLKLSCF